MKYRILLVYLALLLNVRCILGGHGFDLLMVPTLGGWCKKRLFLANRSELSLVPILLLIIPNLQSNKTPSASIRNLLANAIGSIVFQLCFGHKVVPSQILPALVATIIYGPLTKCAWRSNSVTIFLNLLKSSTFFSVKLPSVFSSYYLCRSSFFSEGLCRCFAGTLFLL